MLDYNFNSAPILRRFNENNILIVLNNTLNISDRSSLLRRNILKKN